MKKIKILIAAFIVFGSASMLVQSHDANAFRALKKIQLTGCYSQLTEKLTGYSNNCVSGSGSCEDNGCDGENVEGPTPE